MAYDPIYAMWYETNPDLDKCIEIYENDYEDNPDYMRDEDEEE
jgi:hypothetical protein